MFKNVKNRSITSLLVFVFVFTCVTASFVIIETAHADNNIVYKRYEITYYYCSSAEYASGTPIYSKCVTREDGMEDDDHPEYTEEEVWGWKPVYEWRWWPPERVIVAWDPVFLGTKEVHNDHEYTIIWDPDIVTKRTDRTHWKCR